MILSFLTSFKKEVYKSEPVSRKSFFKELVMNSLGRFGQLLLRQAGLLVATVSLAGCATSIPVKMLKPAEIDLGGAKTIAVLPFSFPSQVETPGLGPYEAALYRLWYSDHREKALERNIARYIESQLGTKLLESDFFTVVRADDLRSTVSKDDTSKKIGSEIVVTGRITTLSSNIKDSSYQTKEGKYVENYEISVMLEVRYDVLRTADNSLIISKNLRASRSRTGKYNEMRQAEESIAKDLVVEQIPQVVRALAPYTVTEYRTLAADETKDPRMEQADKLVKDGFYQKAHELYAKIYAEKKNFAAGYNAAIMLEILGDLDKAIVSMKALADESLNPKALQEQKRMETTAAETKRAATQKAAR